MHDFDRTQVGFSPELESFEYEFGETELGENEVMELAGELLELSSEQEFENFLGDLINKAGSAIANFAGTPAGQALGGMLKSAAKKILPAAGQAIGGYFGGSTGSQIGGQLATAASNLFEAESSEYENEEREWEAASNLVKIATDAARNLAQAAPRGNPVAAARHAVMEAAQKHAPHLLTPAHANGSGVCPPASKTQAGTQSGPQTQPQISGGPQTHNGSQTQSGSQTQPQISGGSQTQSGSQTGLQTPQGGGRSGRWVRHHNRIVLFGT